MKLNDFVEGDVISKLAFRAAHETDVNLMAISYKFLEKYSELLVAYEREKCAVVCDFIAREIDDTNGLATYCAKAIRARGEK